MPIPDVWGKVALTDTHYPSKEGIQKKDINKHNMFRTFEFPAQKHSTWSGPASDRSMFSEKMLTLDEDDAPKTGSE